jgi:3-oxoacyl-[acyl-carrier protein] reductase
MSKLQGKVAVVTGASKGIGAGIAKGLAAEGAAVVVNYSSSKAGADSVVADIKAKGGKAIAVAGSVAKSADVKKLFAEATKAFGKVDVLVNNAGVFAFQPLDDVTEDEYRRQFDTNVLGTLLTNQEAARAFGDKGGSIINVSSVVSSNALPYASIYSATKAAVDSITRNLALELASRKIRVNSVNPGPTETEGAHSLGLFEGDMGQQMLARSPSGRFGRPEDIAPAVVYLASDDAGWVTGESIRVAGGVR